MKVAFANSLDTDQMSQNAESDQGLHWLQQYGNRVPSTQKKQFKWVSYDN